MENKNWRIYQAEKILKNAFLDAALLANALTLLAPFAGNWRVKQALRLLQEYLEDL